jgi:transposase
MTLTRRNEFESLYKKESDSNVKERLFLVMKVEGDGIVPAHVAKDLHRSRTWASDWLARYHKEGTDGLKDR